MNMDNRYMHNSFWNQQQVSITFQFKPIEPMIKDGKRQPPAPVHKPTLIDTLHLEKLGSYLAEQGFILDALKIQDTARPIQHGRDNHQPIVPVQRDMVGMQETESSSIIGRAITDEIGKHLFYFNDRQGRYIPTLVSFFTFTKNGTTDMPMSSTPDRTSEDTMNHEQNPDRQDTSMNMNKNPVAQLVNLLNRDPEKVIGVLDSSELDKIYASPTWQCGGTTTGSNGHIAEGCPLTPPMPVTEVCSTSPGLWPITLPELQPELQDVTGDGVTVFVLDTLPKLATVKRASEVAEHDNLLLADVMENVMTNASYQLLPDVLDVPSPHMPETGKDLYGRLVGFHMADHGLFEAGVIHDIAPDANIECIRVLNDFCVGDLSVLIDALEGIHDRVLYSTGDLYNKPVVINLSLVIPGDSEAIGAGIDPSLLDATRYPLYSAIRALADLDVVFAASAGNEGDLRYEPMNPTGTRPDALYPAAYAYYGTDPINSMIPVGAINGTGKAASYSCYPGPRGVAAYGGEVPAKSAIHTVDHVTHVTKVDGMIGIFSALQYPALLITDRIASYPAPNAHGWAYWVGTSFATPIISALAARILEAKERGTIASGVLVPHTILTQGATRTVQWDRLDAGTHAHVNMLVGQVVWAEQQCKPTTNSEQDEEENVTVNITEVQVDEVRILEA